MLWVWPDGLIAHIKSMMTMTYFSLKKGLPSFDTCLNEGVRAVARQAFLGGIPMVFQKAPQLTVLLCYISNKNIHSHLSHFFGRIFFLSWTGFHSGKLPGPLHRQQQQQQQLTHRSFCQSRLEQKTKICKQWKTEEQDPWKREGGKGREWEEKRVQLRKVGSKIKKNTTLGWSSRKADFCWKFGHAIGAGARLKSESCDDDHLRTSTSTADRLQICHFCVGPTLGPIL